MADLSKDMLFSSLRTNFHFKNKLWIIPVAASGKHVFSELDVTVIVTVNGEVSSEIRKKA